ncbi:hypothetical protein BGZ47_011734 [Haplosporangium gracile]|nr:hypothetical protein BGZ47_011734 [Haplosporangium gracile]
MITVLKRLFRRTDKVVMDDCHPFAAIFGQMGTLNELSATNTPTPTVSEPVATLPNATELETTLNIAYNYPNATKPATEQKAKPERAAKLKGEKKTKLEIKRVERNEINDITNPLLRLENTHLLELFRQTMAKVRTQSVSTSTHISNQLKEAGEVENENEEVDEVVKCGQVPKRKIIETMDEGEDEVLESG